MAVNVSVVQFSQSSVVRDVQRALVDTDFAAPRLELEIAESAMFKGSIAAMTALHGLRNYVVRIAFDDFGTVFFAEPPARLLI